MQEVLILTLWAIAVLLWAFLLACAACFIVLFLDRSGIRGKVAETAPKWLSEMFQCDFCLAFWVSIVVCVILGGIFGSPFVLALSFLAVPIARKLL